MIFCEWNEVPHLSDKEKADLINRIPAYQREARTKGIPCLGSGAIYQVPESDIRVEDFEIPKHWPRGFGLPIRARDWTAAVWGALDREAQVILYLYSVYKRGTQSRRFMPMPSAHVEPGFPVWAMPPPSTLTTAGSSWTSTAALG